MVFAGEMLGTVHRVLLETHQNELKPGSVLVLKQVGSSRRDLLWGLLPGLPLLGWLPLPAKEKLGPDFLVSGSVVAQT